MDEEIKQQQNYSLPISIFAAAVILAGTWIYTAKSENADSPRKTNTSSNTEQTATVLSALEKAVLPSEGVVLPVKWNDIGAKMVSVGVIDAKKFEQVYESRGGLSEGTKKLLYDKNNGNLKITPKNSGEILNLLWALGLGNKNEILESGPMVDKRYGGAGGFASTGGWPLTNSEAMDHYSKHPFAVLTKEQQEMVARVAKNIYRPCCGNPTHFPDCNHGMAMLGLLELMASQGATEAEMYKAALVVNSYWFPENYLTIATYMESKGVEWKNVNPQEMLGVKYSSGQGYAQIASQVVAPSSSQTGGGGCGVDAGAPVAAPKRQSGGCGI